MMVLWFLVLLTIMAGSFALTMRRHSALVGNARDESVIGSLADGGLYFAMLMLSHPVQVQRWRADGVVYEVPLDKGQVRIQIHDEAGKYDINKADAAVLVSLFEKVGLEEEDAQSLADAVLDWRDNDDLIHLKGAEEDEYRDEGRNYGPRNKPFQTIEELRLVLGVNYELYKALKPLITVFSSKGVDPMTASREVLLALPNVDPTVVEDFLLQRSENPKNGALASVFQGLEGIDLSGQKNKLFTIRAEARIDEGPVIGVSAVVERKTTASGEPFTVLHWERFPAGNNNLFDTVAPENVVAYFSDPDQSISSQAATTDRSSSDPASADTKQDEIDFLGIGVDRLRRN